MAGESTVTQTGLAELEASVRRLPEAVTLALRGVAMATGVRVQATARERLLAQTQATKTAAAIEVIPDDANKAVYVTSKGHPDDPANLSLWLEHGTIRMQPKPFMKPAQKAHEEQYHRESGEASEAAVRALLQG